MKTICYMYLAVHTTPVFYGNDNMFLKYEEDIRNKILFLSVIKHQGEDIIKVRNVPNPRNSSYCDVDTGSTWLVGFSVCLFASLFASLLVCWFVSLVEW
jgi:hypothetical protein